MTPVRQGPAAARVRQPVIEHLEGRCLLSGTIHFHPVEPDVAAHHQVVIAARPKAHHVPPGQAKVKKATAPAPPSAPAPAPAPLAVTPPAAVTPAAPPTKGTPAKPAAKGAAKSVTVSGTLLSVATDDTSITISVAGQAAPLTFTVNSTTAAMANGQAITLASLNAGTELNITLAAAGSTVAASITAVSREDSGTIASIDFVNRILILKEAGNKRVIYGFDADAVLTVNGKSTALSAITANSQVNLTLSVFNNSNIISLSCNKLAKAPTVKSATAKKD